ncbi:hypothetical protein ARMSODRAFT_1019974 [Armillaria solidipes]|uniref:Peptidase S53 domain-containing protein n=1 Tax=Armillaria solidipes TaxID=1076256 RepID=A0A2H3BPF9_9AGAR|nr:hypothetical protein ARMSODRAFT_1019974 [Armillaria solidipes]
MSKNKLLMNLDIEYTVGVATGVLTFFISVGDSQSTDSVDSFLALINFLIPEASPPQVLTTSYSFDEMDIPPSVATRLCNAFMTLGAQGMSILFASGNGGVGGSQHGKTCITFIPTFPAGCPCATQGIPETAASFSSRGFLNTFAPPSYQASDVAAYPTTLGNTNAGRFNTTGRGSLTSQHKVMTLRSCLLDEQAWLIQPHPRALYL